MGCHLRIKKNDRPFNVYSHTTIIGSDGYDVNTYTKRYTTMPADMQPIGGKTNLAEYGVNAVSANAKKMFIDDPYQVFIEDIIKDLADNNQYRIVGIKKWYSHTMLLLDWIETKVTLP